MSTVTTTEYEALCGEFSAATLKGLVVKTKAAWSWIAGNPTTASEMIDAHHDVWGKESAQYEALNALTMGADMTADQIRKALS